MPVAKRGLVAPQNTFLENHIYVAVVLAKRQECPLPNFSESITQTKFGIYVEPVSERCFEWCYSINAEKQKLGY
uniref:Uncharacterized protein n=1 Tax=Parascaris equorum TaxID=6256 RepID=A0A914R2F1_PAREQ